MRVLAALCLALAAGSVAAHAPDRSPRPLDRAVPGPVAAVSTAGPSRHVPPPRLRPLLRPLSAQEIAMAALDASYVATPPARSLRPWLRPENLPRLAMAQRQAKKKGSVCGVLDIQGERVGDIPGRIRACGIEDAVRVKSVSGVLLSTGALMNCETAIALNDWTEGVLKPAFRQRGPVVGIEVAAHYACRTRNNQPGGRISEHGKGRAIDISAFRLRDGTEVSVLKNWRHGWKSEALRKVHRGACGPFGTVLGPNSDRFHRDHFHFDTARYRSGPYCR